MRMLLAPSFTELMSRNRTRFIVSALLFILTMLSLNSLVIAKEYQIEAVVFSHNTPQNAYESTQYKPIAEIESEAQTWRLEPSMLLAEVEAIRSSPDYTLISYYSWGQDVLPTSQAAIFSVTEPSLQGWIKVYASHLLFANLDIDFDGYRMVEKRRLKLNEKHYFDHPKFGILMRVSRLISKTEKPATELPATELPAMEIPETKS